jgi:hypothetical protein
MPPKQDAYLLVAGCAYHFFSNKFFVVRVIAQHEGVRKPNVLLYALGGTAAARQDQQRADILQQEDSLMPTNWADTVRDAITNLEIKTSRVLEPDQALAIIDDVVEGKFAAADLATIHGIPQAWIKTTLGQITRAVQGAGRVRSLVDGGWYELRNDDQPYEVAPGFAAAWKKARGLQ